MTKNNRRAITALLTAATLASAALPAARVVNNLPPRHTCTAELIPFEDSSWLGGALRYDGRIVDAHWDTRMPAYGWLPGFRGTPCTLIIKK